MRNVDKVKKLEYELGRYQKKVAEQGAEIERLRKQNADFCKGSAEIQAATDATLTAVCLAYGADATDPDDPGVTLGKRLEVPEFRIADMLRDYEIRARKDEEAGKYIIGIMKREG